MDAISPIRVSPNGRYFVNKQGKPVFWLGDTQWELWHYYTGEAPPLWIIPAWPIANLAINGIVRILRVTRPFVETTILLFTVLATAWLLPQCGGWQRW